MNNGVDMLLHKKITALCCIVFLLAGVGGYTADAAINTEVGSLSGMPLPAPKKSETGKNHFESGKPAFDAVRGNGESSYLSCGCRGA